MGRWFIGGRVAGNGAPAINRLDGKPHRALPYANDFALSGLDARKNKALFFSSAD